MSAPSLLATQAPHVTATAMADGFQHVGEPLKITRISLFSNDLNGLLNLASAAAGNIPILSTTDRLLDHLIEVFSMDGNFCKIYH